jgi:hypothetical protein
MCILTIGLSSRSGSTVQIASTSMNTGRDMAFEKARGIEIGFGKFYGVDTLVILSPMPSSLENVEEVGEDNN